MNAFIINNHDFVSVIFFCISFNYCANPTVNFMSVLNNDAELYFYFDN
ncbi:hypothetical protein SAMN04488097_1013 [Epilithonimonas lactis]|nr:hypothetical protein SAMN04488097_1013 [Epilithonimonas lactis]